MTDAWKGILGSAAIGAGAGFKAKAGVDLEKKQQYKECIMSGKLSAEACATVTGYNPQEGEDMSGVVSEIQNREQNEARLKEIGQLPFPLQGAASETTVQGKPLSLNMRTSMGQLGQGKVNIDEFTPSPQSAEIPGVAPPDWRQKAGVEANRLTGIAETKEQATWESRNPEDVLKRKILSGQATPEEIKRYADLKSLGREVAQPRSSTDQERYFSITSKPEEKWTLAEQDFVTKYLGSSGTKPRTSAQIMKDLLNAKAELTNAKDDDDMEMVGMLENYIVELKDELNGIKGGGQGGGRTTSKPTVDEAVTGLKSQGATKDTVDEEWLKGLGFTDEEIITIKSKL